MLVRSVQLKHRVVDYKSMHEISKKCFAGKPLVLSVNAVGIIMTSDGAGQDSGH